MTLVVTHPYVSTITETTPSGGAGGTVGPSEWNANHTVAGSITLASSADGITGNLPVTNLNSGTGATTATFWRGDGAWGAASGGGGGSVGGSSGSVQFSTGGTFGGDTNFTYGGLGTGVTINLSSSTSTAGISGLSIVTSSSSSMAANSSALRITGTWNNSGTLYDAPLFMNIVNTASAAGSLLMDLQVGSASLFAIDRAGNIQVGANNPNLFYGAQINIGAGAADAIMGQVIASGRGFAVRTDGYVGFSSGNPVGGTNTLDTLLFRQAAGIFAIANGASLTSATALRVYNTVDVANGAPTNFERGVFDWTTSANVLTIGTQSGGSGTARAVAFVSGTSFLDYGVSTAGWLTLTPVNGCQITSPVFLTGVPQAYLGNTDVTLSRVVTGVLGLTRILGAGATGFQVYNTADGAPPTNYERGVIDWTTNANILTVGTQSGGSGTARAMLLVGVSASATSTGVATFASTNCPAVTPSAVYQWVKVNLSDGSTAFIPAWK